VPLPTQSGPVVLAKVHVLAAGISVWTEGRRDRCSHERLYGKTQAIEGAVFFMDGRIKCGHDS
jgi:hypothetical protein